MFFQISKFNAKLKLAKIFSIKLAFLVSFFTSCKLFDFTHDRYNIIKSVLQSNEFFIHGDTYDTNDGTCIRDYIHVNDLASAHLSSLKFLDSNKGFHIFNLGSEQGFSVMEVIDECQKLMKTAIKFKIGSKRDGDPNILVADNKKSISKLGWKLENNSLKSIISSAINFHKNAL